MLVRGEGQHTLIFSQKKVPGGVCRIRMDDRLYNCGDMSLFIPLIPSAPPVRRKVFISYFRGDRLEVEEFVERWAEDERKHSVNTNSEVDGAKIV